MNIVYIVTPLALLAAFAGYVVPANARLDATRAARAATEEQRRVDERRAQEERQGLATRQQQERAAERVRLAAEKARAAEDRQKQSDQILVNNLADAQVLRDSLRSEIGVLNDRLETLVAERDCAEGALNGARATLEMRHIQRRNADLELQRMTLLLADAVDASIEAGTPLYPSPRAR